MSNKEPMQIEIPPGTLTKIAEMMKGVLVPKELQLGFVVTPVIAIGLFLSSLYMVLSTGELGYVLGVVGTGGWAFRELDVKILNTKLFQSMALSCAFYATLEEYSAAVKKIKEKKEDGTTSS